MIFDAYTEALEAAFSLDEIKRARADVAVAIASGAKNLLEINLKRSDGRETSAIVLTTFQERMAFLTACKTIIDRAESRAVNGGGLKTDFSRVPVDP